ncbi:MAG: VOC family protein [Cytophagaceae bacterium]
MPTLSASDLNRAKSFYKKQLGLDVEEVHNGDLMVNTDNGDNILIHQTSQPVDSGNTALTFEVENIESEIEELQEKGIQFEDYDLPDLKTENHIYETEDEKAAWFKDSEGNILCIHESLN